MKTKTYKSTEIIHHYALHTTNDPRMMDILKEYIHGSFHQGKYDDCVIYYGIDHYEPTSYSHRYNGTHLKVCFKNGEHVVMSMKSLKRWGRRFHYFVEDLFHNTYDQVDQRIENIMSNYSSEPLTIETVRKICDKAVERQHEIDLQRAWELFQKHTTYIHPRTGQEMCKMTLCQFITQMEGCVR